MKTQVNNTKKAAILAGLATMIGFIAYKVGEVMIERAGEKLVAQEGDELFLNDTLITADDGLVNVVLNDANNLEVGPGRSVLLDGSIVDLETAAGEELVGSSGSIASHLGRSGDEGFAESNPLAGTQSKGAGLAGLVDPVDVIDEGTLSNTSGTNDTVEAVDDSYSMKEDGVLSEHAGLNDTVSSASYSIESLPDNGIVEMNSDGSFTYTPNENFNGTDTFTYEVTSSDGTSSVASVSIVVDPVADFITDLEVGFGDPVSVNDAVGDFSFSTSTSGADIFQPPGQNEGFIVGIDGEGGQGARIDVNEVLDVTLDTGYVTSLTLDVKNLVGETIEVTVTDMHGDETVWTFYKESATSDSISVTIDGKPANSFDLDTVTGDGPDYLTITSDVPFDTLSMTTLSSDDTGNEGFTLVDITNDPDSAVASFVYPVVIDSDIFEMEGSDVVTYVTLSALPDGAVLSGDVTESSNGTWVVELSEDMDIMLTVPEELPDGYIPTLRATTVDGDDSALSILGGTLDDKIVESQDNDYIEANADDGTVRAQGEDDTIVYNENLSQIDGGSGEDTLLLDNESIDFGNIVDMVDIKNIETIDLSSEDSNDLTNLSVDDVIDMSDKQNILTIEGNDSDSVGLTSDWEEGGTSDGYTVYTYTDVNDATVTLNIDENIDVVIAES